MAESDSFIQEVSEEVRRDRMYAVWRRYGPLLIGAIVIAVLASAGLGWWESRVAAQKAELGGALLAADDIDDPAASAVAFLDVAERGEGQFDYPVIARLRAGAALSQSGQLDEAQAQYETIRDMDGVDPRFRDLAELRIVMMRSESMSPGEMLERLGPLTVDASVWRLPALEYEAAAHLRNDDPEAALSSLRAILDNAQLPAGTQGRVGELIAAVETMIEDVDSETVPSAPEVAPAPTGGAATEEAATPSETDESPAAPDGAETPVATEAPAANQEGADQ